MDNRFKSPEPAPLAAHKPWLAFFTPQETSRHIFKNTPEYLQKLEIKYVTLVVGLLLSIGMGRMSYTQTAHYLDTVDRKNFTLIDNTLYRHISNHLDDVGALFALLAEKDPPHGTALSRYVASPDFQSRYPGITAISSTYYRTSTPLQPSSAFLQTLRKDMQKDGLTNVDATMKEHNVQDNLQKFVMGRNPVFLYTSSLDGRFLALYRVPTASSGTSVRVFVVHCRLRPIINKVLETHPSAYNIIISTLESTPKRTNKILYKQDFFSQKRARDTVTYQNFVHNVGSTLWHFHYECQPENAVLYQNTYEMVALCVAATILFFILAHRLTHQRKKAQALAKKVTTDLIDSQRSLQEAQRIAHMGDWRLVLDSQTFTWSEEMFHIFQTDTIPKTLAAFLTLFDPTDHDTIKNALSGSRKSDAPFEIECRVMDTPQQTRWISLRGHCTEYQDDRGPFISGVAMDIDERKRYGAQIQELAFRDPITGLSNRVHFELTTNETLKNPDTVWPVALIFIHLDGCKLISDSLGHTAGDHIVRSVAKRIQKLAGPQDRAARISGDEFGLFLCRLDSTTKAGYIAEHLLSALAKPIRVLGRTYHVTANIGIAVSESTASNFEDMLKYADLAMCRSKTRGRNVYQFYLPEMSTEAQEQLQLAEEIRQAITRKEFVLHYQPRLCLKTLRIVGAEALLRWQHPARGMLAPEKFMYLAEEQESIAELGKLALEQACLDAVQWRLEGHDVCVAVNLSAKQFIPGFLIEEIIEVLEKTGLPARVLELEITEVSAMQNPATVCLLMQHAKSLGIAFALDDFGIAYSSLSYLKRFPLDYLKIDRSFVSGLPYNNEDIAITRAVTALGHSMRLIIVAEGVDQFEQITCLQEWGIDEIQGYVIAKPMELKQFLQFLDDFRNPATSHPEIREIKKYLANLKRSEPLNNPVE